MEKRTDEEMYMKTEAGTLELKEILNHLWDQRKTIYKAIGIAFILGLLIVIITPRKYTTKVTLLSETQSKSGTSNLLGQLGGLSGMNVGNLLGLNLGGNSGSDVLSPDVYPEVLQSTPFLLDVIRQKIQYPQMDQSITISDYLNKHGQTSIIGYLTQLFKSKNDEDLFVDMPDTKTSVYQFNRKQTDLLQSLSDMIDVEVKKSEDKLMGGNSKILTITVEAADPLVSALLADTVVNTLKKYVIDYNTGKAKKDMEFIRSQYNVAESNYRAAQKKLADFNDSHNNVILARVNSERERLQKDYVLANSLFTALAQMLEKSKIEVQEKTPVFSIIEPAKVPLKKSAPRTSLVLISMIFIGAFVGLVIEIVKMMKQSL